MQAKQGEVFDFMAEGQVETDEENDMKSFNDDTIIDKKEGIGKDVKPLFLNQAHATEDVKEVFLSLLKNVSSIYYRDLGQLNT